MCAQAASESVGHCPSSEVLAFSVAANLMGAPGPIQCAVQIACSVSGCAVDDLYDLALPLPGWVEVPEAPGGKACPWRV